MLTKRLKRFCNLEEVAIILGHRNIILIFLKKIFNFYNCIPSLSPRKLEIEHKGSPFILSLINDSLMVEREVMPGLKSSGEIDD